ncbi:integrator complex subunit 3-like isoform X1 [Zingiber officinale]|uniref:integrator complex subunit 3-like isoform X1 n=1 Tax=Zingiber officinale TaxID=94328 RepID=UPI001C4D5A64|nr:integrator complex subunit 3-like isoform X1 [Zingiber officinale]XP_042469837.1 integrator complex subunit 3-like isoform X1 [Zingiber officinale]
MCPERLLRTVPHEAENPIEKSLREAFLLLQDQLKPPFPLTIPFPPEYSQLNHAIAFGILAQPHLAKVHLTHLHSIVVDGYEIFTSILLKLCNESFSRLLEVPKCQLLWVCSMLIHVSAEKIETLFISLMRQITGGDFSESNLWLSVEVLKILSNNWDWLVEEPIVLSSALYVYLRLLADHFRLGGSFKLEELKRMEIDFCVKALREHFQLSMHIGRDLVRILQDVTYIPEFKDIWKDLLFDPKSFQVSEFSSLSNLYWRRTPSHFFLLRISPQMESQLRFLLTFVKWGSQKRYQTWFVKKHLYWPGSESMISDIVRFICCVHHPSNEIIHSNVISRWAVIGWLLKSCRRNYYEANAKLALFYDWLFFDEKIDNIMNIEPAMLLMVNSVPQYVDITHMLLEFLFLLVDNYDVHHREMLAGSVSASINLLLRKGVVHSLDPLISCNSISPALRERLNSFLPALHLCCHKKVNEDETSIDI